MHLIESIGSVDITDINDEINNINYTKLRLSKFTYDQIVNDYKLFYDKDKYNKTKNLMAKKIYHLALQWKGDNDFSYANISTLAQRMPMVDVADKYKKRDIKKALKELNDKEIVKIKYDQENPDKVYFVFNEGGERPKKYNTYKEVVQRYTDMGFTEEEMDQYLDIQDIRYVQALLRYIDSKKKISNAKKYLIKCINDKIEIPSKYFGD